MSVILPCETQNWIECKDLFTLLSEQSSLEDLSALIRAHLGKEGSLAYSLGRLHGLCAFLEHYCSEDERIGFFSKTLPCIVRTAACLEERAPTGGIPFVTQQEAASIVLQRDLVASLLANALLCTFPSAHLVDAGIVPFNFDKFLATFVSNPQSARQQAAKLKCILSYFDRLFDLGGSIKGLITLRRQVVAHSDIASLATWVSCERPLCPVLVDHTHGVEAAPFDTLQVEFANCNIGGSVLDTECLQEEVRFCVSPELLVAVMTMDRMEANEAIIITGIERFSECRGYGETLEYIGAYHDTTMRDSFGTLVTSVVALDATPYIWNTEQQYEGHHVLRELNKAYTGFVCQQTTSDLATSVEEVSSKHTVPIKGSTGTATVQDRKLNPDGLYLESRPLLPGMGAEPVMSLLLPAAQGSRTSYAWSVASTFDETSRPVSPSELNKIAFSLVSSLDEYASMLAETIVAEAIASLSGCASVPMVTSLLEEKDHLETANEDVPSSPSKVDAFLNTLGSAESLPNQNDRLTMYSLRWHSTALRPVATGNWGCGKLGGDVQLKALIQWMAVSASGRPAMVYFTDQNQDLLQLPDAVAKLLVRKCTVGQLCQSVQDYTRGRRNSGILTWLLDRQCF